MNIQDIQVMQVSIGFGENNFTMKQGSFTYKQKIAWKRELVLVKKRCMDTGIQLVYQDSKTTQEYCFVVANEDGKVSVDLISDIPQEVNRFWITLPSHRDEKIYGCGEIHSKFNLKGENVRIWVAEHHSTKKIATKLIKEKLIGRHPKKRLAFHKYESYYAQPTFTSSEKYYLHVRTNAYSEMDFRKSDSITLYLQERPSFIIESGDTFGQVSEKLSNLLGRPSHLPDWLYDGAILAVQEGTQTIDSKIAKAESAGVPVKGIWSQDWCGCRRTSFGYQVMWNWRWDEELYPDLDIKIVKWKEKGIHFLGYINPFIALEKELYQEAAEKGYCVKNVRGEDYQVSITTFPAAMIDFTNPEAYAWYKNLIKENMINLGMSGWMADFGEYLPVDAVLFSGENPATLHNQWPAIWAKLNREAIAECGKEEEVFFFTRAGHTKTIPYTSLMWTGDQHVDWSEDEGLASVIPATLSLAMSGSGIAHSDIGGYTTINHMRRSKELLLRWEEMNAFTPLFRTHEGNQPVNNAQFDDDTELLEQLAKFATIHVKLKPYLQACVEELVSHGTPVMRPLFYHYDEPEAYEEMTEYLLGADMLVAPVYKKGVTTRICYLPDDKWVHLFTKKEYRGGKIEVEAPIGMVPVFVRKKSTQYKMLMQITEI